MNEEIFIDQYFTKCAKLLTDKDASENIRSAKKLILDAKKSGNKLIFGGNGASASIASHASLDFTKQGGIRSVNFNEPTLITAFSNDFGYENWLKKAVEYYADVNDVLILISSSGNSSNIVKAAQYAKDSQIKVITFTGFEKNNPVKQIGDINFWLNSKSYNIIEGIHQLWLLCICDLIIGKTEYAVS